MKEPELKKNKTLIFFSLKHSRAEQELFITLLL